MNLKFNTRLADSYHSSSQIARVLTEDWVKQNSYCPNCGQEKISEYSNNKPVADFYCSNCSEDYELKSKDGKLGSRILDGAYSTMIQRITSESNPNFFFLTYDRNKWSVNNFIIIPKHFFLPEIIEKRKPLAQTARRAGWLGCNIDLAKIPMLGRIFLVKDSRVVERQGVLNNWNRTVFLRNKTIESKGWTLDVLKCIDNINRNEFELNDVYKFEAELKQRHPGNNFIKDKIRQQLQVLRDKGVIEFVSKGKYKKVQQ